MKPTLKLLVLLFAAFYCTPEVNAGLHFEIVEGMSDATLKSNMENNVNTMLTVFQNASETQQKSVKLSKDYMTDDAISRVKEIWKSSAMSCPSVNINARCLKTKTGYQVRGIPVDMIEADENESRQELTIDFLPTGKISGVSIAIDMHRYDEIMAEKESDIDYARRQIIVNFIEDFRTAYNRKDINYLKQVYSDNALIITGKVIKEKPNSQLDQLTLANNKVVYIKQTKQEYIQNLTRIMNTTKYLNVKFDEIEVVQHPKYDDIYGVTLKQYWHTNRYSDTGYLFLMIDFRDLDNPQIQVRTWQPYKDANGNIQTAQADVFHLGSFRIVR